MKVFLCACFVFRFKSLFLNYSLVLDKYTLKHNSSRLDDLQYLFSIFNVSILYIVDTVKAFLK